MRISNKRSRQDFSDKRHRANQFIRVAEVRLIDEQGVNYGVVSTAKALEMAQERGLDLVEVSPLAQPPVVKIVDYSKLRYREEKERRKERARQKKIEIKGIRLSLRIGEHDTEVRVNQAKKFLEQGDKVKLEIILRGRERQHTYLAKSNIDKFITAIQAIIPVIIEQPVSIQGGRLSVLIAKQ